MTRIGLVVLLVVVASNAGAQEIRIRETVRPPPVNFAGLKLLTGKPPSGPCSLPAPQPAQVPAGYLELRDTSRVELAAGWETVPPSNADPSSIDGRMLASDGSTIALQRQRNGAHGRSFMKYRNFEDAKGITCFIQADTLGAIWDLYEPDPAMASSRLRYAAFGEVVTPAGHWYHATVWGAVPFERDRAASTITALLLRQPRDTNLTATVRQAADTFTAGTPAAVASAYFAALEKKEWGLAVDLMDLGEFERYLRDLINMPQIVMRPMTVEQYMKGDSTIPRAVAEWMVERSNTARKSQAEYELREFADVDSLAQLGRMTSYEAATRWLRARDPDYIISRAVGSSGCDTTAIVQMIRQISPKRRVYGAVETSPYGALAIYGPERPLGPSPTWSGRPSLLELRRGAQGWKVYWSQMLGNEIGAMGFGNMSCKKTGG